MREWSQSKAFGGLAKRHFGLVTLHAKTEEYLRLGSQIVSNRCSAPPLERGNRRNGHIWGGGRGGGGGGWQAQPG